MLIDRVLPAYDQREYHAIQIRGDRRRIYQAARRLDFADTAIIRTLFVLRGFPAAVTGMDDLQKMGFVMVAEAPGAEFVLGLIGKFWKPSGQIEKMSAAQYLAFDRLGYAKAAWNFSTAQSRAGVVRLSTETRIKGMDDLSQKRFRLYWLVIGPFSALIRREMLRSIKQRIEQGTAPACG